MNGYWIYLVLGALAVGIITSIARHFRSRHLTRWLKALDIHADREISEERRWRALKNVQVTGSTT